MSVTECSWITEIFKCRRTEIQLGFVHCQKQYFAQTKYKYRTQPKTQESLWTLSSEFVDP